MSELRDEKFTGAIQPGFVSDSDIKSGGSGEELWEGTLEQLRLQKVLCINRGASRTSIRPKGDGAFILNARFAFEIDEDPNNPGPRTDAGFIDTLELEINVSQRHYAQASAYHAYFSDYDPITHHSALATRTLLVIGDCERKFHSGQPLRDKADWKFHYRTIPTEGHPNGEDYAYDTLREAIEAEFFDRLGEIGTLTAVESQAAIWRFEEVAYMGVTSFIEYDSVFRRTITAGHPAAIKATNTGAGMIWTSAELIAFEGLAGDLSNGYFSLPPDAQWHKDKPRVLAAWGQKTQITYSYTQIATASALSYKPYRPRSSGGAILLHDPATI